MIGQCIFSEYIDSENTDARKWVKIAPNSGTFQKSGQEISFSDKLIRKIANTHEKLMARGYPPPIIDYEHYSRDPQKTPEQRVLAGEVHGYDVRSDGLYAEVEFTPPAKTYVENREYRRVSPELHLEYADPETGDPMGPYIPAIALTTRPFLPNLGEINFSTVSAGSDIFPKPQQKGREMDKRIYQLLGLDTEASDDAVVAALSKLQESGKAEAEKIKTFSAESETQKAKISELEELVAESERKAALSAHKEFLGTVVGKKITTATAETYFSQVESVEEFDALTLKIGVQKEMLDALPEGNLIPETDGEIQTEQKVKSAGTSTVAQFFSAQKEKKNPDYSAIITEAFSQFGEDAVVEFLEKEEI